MKKIKTEYKRFLADAKKGEIFFASAGAVIFNESKSSMLIDLLYPLVSGSDYLKKLDIFRTEYEPFRIQNEKGLDELTKQEAADFLDAETSLILNNYKLLSMISCKMDKDSDSLDKAAFGFNLNDNFIEVIFQSNSGKVLELRSKDPTKILVMVSLSGEKNLEIENSSKDKGEVSSGNINKELGEKPNKEILGSDNELSADELLETCKGSSDIRFLEDSLHWFVGQDFLRNAAIIKNMIDDIKKQKDVS